MNSKKGFGLVGLLIAVLLIALLSGGAFYGYKGGLFGGGTASSTITGPIDAANKAKDLLEKKNQEVVQEISTSSTADWKTYKNEEYGFEFKYPSYVKYNTFDLIMSKSVPEAREFIYRYSYSLDSSISSPSGVSTIEFIDQRDETYRTLFSVSIYSKIDALFSNDWQDQGATSFGGVSARKLTLPYKTNDGTLIGTAYIIVPIKNIAIVFPQQKSSDNGPEISKQEQTDILSSFKFTK